MSPGDQLTGVFFDVLNDALSTLLAALIETTFSLIVTPFVEAILAAFGFGMP